MDRRSRRIIWERKFSPIPFQRSPAGNCRRNCHCPPLSCPLPHRPLHSGRHWISAEGSFPDGCFYAPDWSSRQIHYSIYSGVWVQRSCCDGHKNARISSTQVYRLHPGDHDPLCGANHDHLRPGCVFHQSHRRPAPIWAKHSGRCYLREDSLHPLSRTRKSWIDSGNPCLPVTSAAKHIKKILVPDTRLYRYRMAPPHYWKCITGPDGVWQGRPLFQSFSVSPHSPPWSACFCGNNNYLWSLKKRTLLDHADPGVRNHPGSYSNDQYPDHGVYHFCYFLHSLFGYDCSPLERNWKERSSDGHFFYFICGHHLGSCHPRLFWNYSLNEFLWIGGKETITNAQ